MEFPECDTNPRFGGFLARECNQGDEISTGIDYDVVAEKVRNMLNKIRVFSGYWLRFLFEKIS